MDKIKKGLGRGLSSLIGETKAEVQKNQLPIIDFDTKQISTKKEF
jgi:ParB family chromosome partitioning protein